MSGDGEDRNGLEEHKEPAPVYVPKITGRFAQPIVNPVQAPMEIFLGVGVENQPPPVKV